MDILNLFSNYGVWAWASLAAILLVAELLTGTTYLLWFGITAGILAIFTYLFPNFPLSVDFLVFGLLSILNVLIGKKYFPLSLSAQDNDINVPNNRMIGQNVIAAEDFINGNGFVKFGDTQWRAICDNHNPKKDESLKIKSVDGATLIIETHN